MDERLLTILIAVLGSSVLSALINALHDSIKTKRDRKNAKADKAEEKQDRLAEVAKTVSEISARQTETDRQLDALRDAMKYALLDRIIYLGQKYIEAGEVDFDDRRRLRNMHHSYHSGLGGNGDADQIMRAVDDLPLKNHGG